MSVSVCQPKMGSLDSLILYAGKNFLENAHYVLACELFPEEQIAVAAPPEDDYSNVFLCKEHVVFTSQDIGGTSRAMQQVHALNQIRLICSWCNTTSWLHSDHALELITFLC